MVYITGRSSIQSKSLAAHSSVSPSEEDIDHGSNHQASVDRTALYLQNLSLPFHRLDELTISHIFLLNYPQTYELLAMYRAFLASVCRRWREIAHTTPLLWTAVDVHLTWPLWDPGVGQFEGVTVRQRVKFFVKTLSAIFSRTVAGSLDLKVLEEKTRFWNHKKMPRISESRLIPTMTNELHRVRSMKLNTYDGGLAEHLLCHTHLPALKHLHFEAGRRRPIGTPRTLFASEQGMPPLETFVYNDYDHPLSFKDLNLPHLRIFEYRTSAIQRQAGVAFARFIQGCSNLERLSIHCKIITARRGACISSSSLTHFELRTEDSNGSSPLASAPKLRHMVMELERDSSGYGRAANFNDWHELPSLVTLKVHNSFGIISHNTAVDVMSIAPKLTCLHITAKLWHPVVNMLVADASRGAYRIAWKHGDLERVCVILSASDDLNGQRLWTYPEGTTSLLSARPDLRIEWWCMPHQANRLATVAPPGVAVVVRSRAEIEDEAWQFPSDQGGISIFPLLPGFSAANVRVSWSLIDVALLLRHI